MGSFLRGIIRASSFFRKEIFEVIRQPRLVTVLVLGPFLILFIFGIGYRDQPRTLRTLYVANANSAIPAQNIRQYWESIGSVFIYSGVTASQSDALDQLRRGQVDVVVIEPGDAPTVIQNNEQGVFTLYHNEIDPVQVSYIDYLGWIYVGAVNQAVLRSLALQGQKDAVNVQADLQAAHQAVDAMRQAVQIGDAALISQKQQGINSSMELVSLVFGSSLGLLDSFQQTKNSGGGGGDPLQSILADLRQNTKQLDSPTATKDERLTSLDKIDNDISNLENQLTQFQKMDPTLLVNPFRSETKSTANVQPTVLDFFAPAVLALLLQHLAVTFAALSIVRERSTGTMELFRVSPLSAGEALLGKYLSYMLFGGVISAILSALLVFVLHIPMLGNWYFFAIVIAVMLFTSLGIGFVISIISQTDSQAVQYSMIILLASVFFSGFIMSLELFWQPVKIISWALPATYGISLLRDISLRGIAPNWGLLAGLFAIGIVLMLYAWRLMHRLITKAR